jgi:hypothetical protein
MARWQDVVRGIAPALGTALLGPQAGAAIGVLSEKFLGRKDGTAAEVEERLTAGWKPEDELKLKELEQSFALLLLDKVTAAEAIDASDRASAREREKSLKDWTPQALAVATFSAFFILLFLMVRHSIPASNQQVMSILLGVLAGAVTQILNYYFGSSTGSASARAVITRIAEGKK